MGPMALWRHERRIVSSPSSPASVVLIDELTFQPRLAKGVARWFIKRFFTHRHEVLRKNLGGIR